MSITKHTIAVTIDKVVSRLQDKHSADGKLPDAKAIVTTAVVASIVRGLSLPTAEVVNVSQYWWDTHQQVVANKLSGINEVYPIYIQQALTAIKYLYEKRYETAFPRTTEQVLALMCKFDMSLVEGLAPILNLGLTPVDIISLTEVFDNV